MGDLLNGWSEDGEPDVKTVSNEDQLERLRVLTEKLERLMVEMNEHLLKIKGGRCG